MMEKKYCTMQRPHSMTVDEHVYKHIIKTRHTSKETMLLEHATFKGGLQAEVH